VLAGAVLGAAMALPLVYLLITVADSAGEAIEIIASARTLDLTARSVALAAAVTATATAIAVPFAWLTARTDLPGRRVWSVLAALPLVIPSYIGAYAILSALGPAGLLRDALQGPFGVERLPDITGFLGAWLVLTLFTYPLVLLPVRAALRGLDPQLEEAALGMGRSQWEAVRTVVLPAAVLVYWSLQSFSGTPNWGETLSAAGSSLLVSGLAALAAAACTLPIAVLAVRFPSRGTRLIERTSYVGYALPGIVVALSLVFFATRVFPAVYQTLGLLVFAFVVLFLPLAIGSARASLQQVSPSVEEAARSLGRSPLNVLRTVTAPLIASGTLAGAALVFLTAIKELPATLILAPIGFETLATEIWSATSVGFFERGAIPSLVLLAVSLPSLYLLLDRE
jgi:ABC-type Fe3+ transport system permease subunit